MSYEESGKYYGYPDCCIKQFIETVGSLNETCTRVIYSKNSGFIPCDLCVIKLKNNNNLKLKDFITNRKCKIPFN